MEQSGTAHQHGNEYCGTFIIISTTYHLGILNMTTHCEKNLLVNVSYHNKVK